MTKIAPIAVILIIDLDIRIFLPLGYFPGCLIFESAPPQNLGRNYINKTHTAS